MNEKLQMIWKETVEVYYSGSHWRKPWNTSVMIAGFAAQNKTADFYCYINMLSTQRLRLYFHGLRNAN
jgi:hypothetical protein